MRGKIGLPLKVSERKAKPIQVSEYSFFLNIERSGLKVQSAATIVSCSMCSFNISNMLSNCSAISQKSVFYSKVTQLLNTARKICNTSFSSVF